MSQTIDVPAQSVWCVTILANGDIAAGCSDHHIYVFSNDSKRIVAEDRLVRPIFILYDILDFDRIGRNNPPKL